MRMEGLPASAFTIINYLNPCFCKKVGHMLHKHVVIAGKGLDTFQFLLKGPAF